MATPDSYLSDAELIFLRELGRLGVKFMVVGMSAAVVQGSDRATEDIDLWFASRSDPGIGEAARAAGGVFAWRASPPMISGKDLANIDIVSKCSGLGSFESEYEAAVDVEILGVSVKALPIERVIVSKTAADRPKDRAALPSLRATLVAIKASRGMT
jgi:predicted nucleotidyltransferase